jgi:hypothetical protein
MTWVAIRQRCNNPNHPRFKDWGGRGIRICKRWDKFENFLADMGEKPPGLTIERKRNSGNYTPTNCVWATHLTQMNNRRDNWVVTYRGQTMNVMAWSRKLGINHLTLRWRLGKGWPINRAFNQ